MAPTQITGSTFRGGLLRGVLAGAVALLVVYGVLDVFQSYQTGSLPTSGLTLHFTAAAELPLEYLGGTQLTKFAVVHGIMQLAPDGVLLPIGAIVTGSRVGPAGQLAVRIQEAYAVRLRAPGAASLADSLFAGHPPDRAWPQPALSRALSSGNTVGCSRHGARV